MLLFNCRLSKYYILDRAVCSRLIFQFDCFTLRLELHLKQKIFMEFYDNFMLKYNVDIKLITY